IVSNAVGQSVCACGRIQTGRFEYFVFGFLGRTDEARISALIGRRVSKSLLIQVDTATDANALNATLALGRTVGLAAYDAAYLELALRLGLPLTTLDTRLAEAARRCGVELLIVDEERAG
ncbi:type II toxin-antitoxin system VapC family toxin, partial [Pelatocladus sp. BLCC-F211]|uniref:type II toxin-antitoxin system VapC family toxin n=1 Tax=Pelatocladus sp. BLCC-F211 TaxID=3342752 RepID=UPI0035BA9A5B